MGKRKAAYTVEPDPILSALGVVGPDGVVACVTHDSAEAKWLAGRLDYAHRLAIKLERQRARARRAKGRR